MKRLAITLFLVIITNTLFGQPSAIEQPNKSVIRLTVVNDKGDILLKKSPLGWVTIATFHTKRQNFNQVLDSLTNTFGIEISKPELGGLFTYTYNFKNSADTRLMFKAKYLGGEIKQGVKGYYFTWFPVSITMNHLVSIIPISTLKVVKSENKQ